MQISPETIRFIEEHASDDVCQLALQTKKYPQVDLSTAMVQISGRQIAEAKIPSWSKVQGLLYPKHLSMEQCSSEATACYKAELVKGDTLGGIARKYYGRASAWKKIADANADLLKGKTLIRPGMKLQIPRP